MRVLHVTGAYPTPANPENGSLVQAQVESLRAAGVDVRVLVLEGSGAGKYVRGVSRVRRALWSEPCDLVHAHYTYTGWSARLATRLPLVVSFMGSDVLGAIDSEGRSRWESRAFHGWLSSTLARVSALGIAKSQGLADCLGTRRKVVLPNGVDLSVFRPLEVDPGELGMEPGKRHVLFAGRVGNARKRYALAREVVERAERAEHAVGPVQLVAIERRPHREVARFLNAADCLLLTSRQEGSPNIVKEALACNTPIVAVNVGDVRDRIAGVHQCRVTSEDAQELASALVEVLRSGERSRDGRESVRDLSSEAVAGKVIALYEGVLRSSRWKGARPAK